MDEFGRGFVAKDRQSTLSCNDDNIFIRRSSLLHRMGTVSWAPSADTAVVACMVHTFGNIRKV